MTRNIIGYCSFCGYRKTNDDCEECGLHTTTNKSPPASFTADGEVDVINTERIRVVREIVEFLREDRMTLSAGEVVRRRTVAEEILEKWGMP